MGAAEHEEATDKPNCCDGAVRCFEALTSAECSGTEGKFGVGWIILSGDEINIVAVFAKDGLQMSVFFAASCGLQWIAEGSRITLEGPSADMKIDICPSPSVCFGVSVSV